jgi:succinoglycan biosynthesis protein ExoO
MNMNQELSRQDRVCADSSVTVLIPAYNAAPFLHRAVRSALDQTCPPMEVIVVDDGSTDDTAEVARKLGLADPRVRVICLPENVGPAKARNTGLNLAGGEWVAVLDADDAFMPERLEGLTRAANELNADIVVDNFAWYDVATKSIGAPGLAPSSANEVIDKYEFVSRARGGSANEADWGLLQPMFKLRFLDEHNLRYPSFSRHGEDFLLMVDLLVAGARLVLVRTPGYLYTIRTSGLSRTRIDYDAMAAHIVDLLRSDGIHSDERLKRLLRKRIFAIRRLSAEHKLRSRSSTRSFGAIGRLILTDYWVARMVVRAGLRKVRNRLLGREPAARKLARG